MEGERVNEPEGFLNPAYRNGSRVFYCPNAICWEDGIVSDDLNRNLHFKGFVRRCAPKHRKNHRETVGWYDTKRCLFFVEMTRAGSDDRCSRPPTLIKSETGRPEGNPKLLVLERQQSGHTQCHPPSVIARQAMCR